METIKLVTKKRAEFIDITTRVESIVKSSSLDNGFCLVFCPHTTVGLTINENADPSVKKDMIEHLQELVPEGKRYSHLEGNADSHIKSSMMGASLNVIIENQKLVLGTWQGIYFCEFDGPRERYVHVQVLGK